MLMALASGAASAQTPEYEPPRTENGRPDLQGIWTNASLTRLERTAPFTDLILPAERVAIANRMHTGFLVEGAQTTDPDAPAPAAGEDVGGYNTFWLEYGESYGRIGDDYRTSWIVEPADGRLPFSAAGAEVRDQKLRQIRQTATDPETRPLGERCLVGFGSSAGPPMLNVDYNNLYQIVQTEDHVMILAEMNHDARVIPLVRRRVDGQPPKWMGESIGWWEGDTLVVETTNFHPDQSLRVTFAMSLYISPDAEIVERFTRTGDDEMLYEFRVDDPAIYSQVWSAEMPLRMQRDRIYEYACHEGNYAMAGILGGARLAERGEE